MRCGGFRVAGAAAARALVPLAPAPGHACPPGAGAVGLQPRSLTPFAQHAPSLLPRSQLRHATQDCGLWRREFEREFGEAGPLQARPTPAAVFHLI